MFNFTVPITVSNGNYVFAFTRIESPSAEKYFVNVQQGPGNIAAFEMKKNYNGAWRVTEPVPEWIREMETALSDLIRARL